MVGWVPATTEMADETNSVPLSKGTGTVESTLTVSVGRWTLSSTNNPVGKVSRFNVVDARHSHEPNKAQL